MDRPCSLTATPWLMGTPVGRGGTHIRLRGYATETKTNHRPSPERCKSLQKKKKSILGQQNAHNHTLAE